MPAKFIARSYTISYTFRDSVNSVNKLTIPQLRTNYLRNSFRYSGAVLWNNLPESLRQVESQRNFKSKAEEKTALFKQINR